MNERYDTALLGILQSCGELEPFLDVILGFLFRKTDFFLPLTSDQSMGFPPGAAQQKLLQVIYYTILLIIINGTVKWYALR